MQLFVELHSTPNQGKMTSFKKTTVQSLSFIGLHLELTIRRKRQILKCQLRGPEYKVYGSSMERPSNSCS